MVKRNKVVEVIRKKTIQRSPKKQSRAASSKRGKRSRITKAFSISPALALGESVVNPYECSCCIPDGATGVGCFSTKNVVQLLTGTAGSCAMLALQPCPDSEYFAFGSSAGTTTATPTVTGNWVPTAADTTIDALYEEYRPVSCGMRGIYYGNTQTDGGTILCGQVSGELSVSEFNGRTLTQAASLMQYYRMIPLRNGFNVCWRPESQDDQEVWTAFNGTQAVGGTAGGQRPYLVMIIYGANASQNLLTVEYVVNYEGMFVDNTYYPGGISQSTSKTPAEPGWYEKAKNVASHVEAVTPYIASIASAGVKAWGGDYMGALGDLANGFQAPGSMGVYNRALGDQSTRFGP